MANIITDALTNASQVAVRTYSSSWKFQTGYTTEFYANTNGVGATATSQNCGYYNDSVAPPSADYSVSADVSFESVLTGNSATICARMQPGVTTFYYAALSSAGSVELVKRVSGSWNALSTTTTTVAAGNTYRLKLEVNGSSISVYVDGVLKIGPITDTSISSAGRPGFAIYSGSTGTYSNTTGLHIKNFSADTLAAAGASGSFAITAADATFSGGGIVRPMASFAITAADSLFSGSAGQASADAAFSVATADSIFSGAASGDVSTGTITTPALKNNTGTVLANETGITAFVYNVATGALVVSKTGETTDASGILAFSDASLAIGTTYRVVIVLSSGAEGMDKVAAA